MKTLLVLVLAMVVMTGCATLTEGDRHLNQQNAHIGAYILNSAEAPEIKQAGSDVRKNSEQLVKTIGVPENPVGQYTPEYSAEFRVQSEEEHEVELTILDKVKDFLPGWAGTALGFITAGWAFFKKRTQDRKVLSLYNGVQNLKDELKAGGSLGDKATSVINAVMRNSAIAHNLYTEIKQDLNNFKKLGKLNEG